MADFEKEDTLADLLYSRGLDEFVDQARSVFYEAFHLDEVKKELRDATDKAAENLEQLEELKKMQIPLLEALESFQSANTSTGSSSGLSSKKLKVSVKQNPIKESIKNANKLVQDEIENKQSQKKWLDKDIEDLNEQLKDYQKEFHLRKESLFSSLKTISGEDLISDRINIDVE